MESREEHFMLDESTTDHRPGFHFDPDILANLREYSEEIERVRKMTTDPGLGVEVDVSPQAKQRAMHALYVKREKRYYDLVEKKRREAADAFYSAQYKLFAPKGGESSMLSFRDALYRLDGVDDAGKLSQMLERSYEVGDDTMARALFRRGYELQSRPILERYLAMYPDQRKSYERFTQAAETHNALGANMPPGRPERPPELRGYSPPSDASSAGEGAA
jgi:GrpB-like predicted nucleotidyltransferase (UPF0157 family)